MSGKAKVSGQGHKEAYSVLMSVYAKEKAEYLDAALQSMFSQTLPPDEFVLVCDGPLSPGLEDVIQRYAERLTLVRLAENRGLGNALNEGLGHCSNEIVVRMDSDDISLPRRCECQLSVFEAFDVSIVSGTVREFMSDGSGVSGEKRVPLGHEEIARFSRRRNPFNHPASAFRKSAVLSAGGYSEKYHLFEDYDLWVRMLRMGYRGRNLEEPLLCMRVSEDIYQRRGGFVYAVDLLRFHWMLYQSGWSRIWDFLCFAIPHAAVCLLPVFARRLVYHILRGNYSFEKMET